MYIHAYAHNAEVTPKNDHVRINASHTRDFTQTGSSQWWCCCDTLVSTPQHREEVNKRFLQQPLTAREGKDKATHSLVHANRPLELHVTPRDALDLFYFG